MDREEKHSLEEENRVDGTSPGCLNDSEVKVSEAIVETQGIEIKNEEGIVKTEDTDEIEVGFVQNVESRGGGSAFLSARAVLLNEAKGSVLSPGFKSAAALAGWDDEALLLASFEEESPFEDFVSVSQVVEDSPVRESRERKREARTPALANTPSSAGRRNRRIRIEDPDSAELLRVGALSLEDCQENDINEPKPATQPQQYVQGNEKQDEGSPVIVAGIERDTSPPKVKNDDTQTETSPVSSSKGSSKPACLDQLKEELSCAVCLDICFEPSSTSCGHSFCKPCLENVVEKCGPRCPKCRQQLRGEFRTFQINTVLWNTIQLLFPKEIAGKIKEKGDKDAALKLEVVKENSNHSYISQASRGVRNNGSNWRGHPIRGIGLSRPASSSSFRRAFQSAAASSQRRPILITGDDEVEQEENHVGNAEQEAVELTERAAQRQERGRRNSSRQENQLDLDAVLASRLQQEELLRSFRSGGRSRSQARRREPFSQASSVSSAAANLRAMASRAIHLRVRNQS